MLMSSVWNVVQYKKREFYRIGFGLYFGLEFSFLGNCERNRFRVIDTAVSMLASTLPITKRWNKRNVGDMIDQPNNTVPILIQLPQTLFLVRLRRAIADGLYTNWMWHCSFQATSFHRYLALGHMTGQVTHLDWQQLGSCLQTELPSSKWIL